MKKVSAVANICNSFAQGIDPSEITEIQISQSAVDEELMEVAGLSKSKLYPEGKILGTKLRVVPNIKIIYKEEINE